MTINIRPLTKRELVECFKPYRDAFPDWTVEHDVVLARRNGPIKQFIALESLRSGGYRPSCSIEVLIGPPAQMLFQFLDVKHRQVLPREHLAKWPRVLNAMEEQFLPPIRKPLDVAEVLRLGEEEVARDKISNINYFSGLAALHAYVGDTERALFWCDKAEKHLEPRGNQVAQWQLQRAKFTRQLKEAINSGQQEVFVLAMISA